jgi:hypothetical protein
MAHVAFDMTTFRFGRGRQTRGTMLHDSPLPIAFRQPRPLCNLLEVHCAFASGKAHPCDGENGREWGRCFEEASRPAYGRRVWLDFNPAWLTAMDKTSICRRHGSQRYRFAVTGVALHLE